MTTKLVRAYSYDSLSPAARRVARDEFRHINVEHLEWWDGVYERWIEKIENLGFTDVKPRFSGFASQGDGASFTAGVDVQKFLEANKLCNRFRTVYNLLKEGFSFDTYGFRLGHLSNHYCHEYTVDFDPLEVEYEFYDFTTKDLQERQQRAIEQAEELTQVIEEKGRQLMRDLYRSLDLEHDYLTSDESVVESIRTNSVPLWFFENGKAYKYD